MPVNQVFEVFAFGDSATEYYEVFVGENLDELILVGSDDDQGNHDFYTPDWGSSWRYIILVGTVGINYYIYSEQRWCWHSKRMPAGAYDPTLVMTEGYQISTLNATKFTFIGV
ncbi:MAG: hypothetical protein JSV96_07440 [Candidatus Aminicenantes bacterium]|nr:MAG: hypothetical protein JSV96_07440 [Candidatus Aminicenantes bacterium]